MHHKDSYTKNIHKYNNTIVEFYTCKYYELFDFIIYLFIFIFSVNINNKAYKC